ncbi:hypothetical protein EV361DRAFT_929136 [Lentinula raphanica]|nr:hypothetical protein EV361DRAFT_929136 [Lentinula raphanica]
MPHNNEDHHKPEYNPEEQLSISRSQDEALLSSKLLLSPEQIMELQSTSDINRLDIKRDSIVAFSTEMTSNAVFPNPPAERILSPSDATASLPGPRLLHESLVRLSAPMSSSKNWSGQALTDHAKIVNPESHRNNDPASGIFLHHASRPLLSSDGTSSQHSEELIASENAISSHSPSTPSATSSKTFLHTDRKSESRSKPPLSNASKVQHAVRYTNLEDALNASTTNNSAEEYFEKFVNKARPTSNSAARKLKRGLPDDAILSSKRAKLKASSVNDRGDGPNRTLVERNSPEVSSVSQTGDRADRNGIAAPVITPQVSDADAIRIDDVYSLSDPTMFEDHEVPAASSSYPADQLSRSPPPIMASGVPHSIPMLPSGPPSVQSTSMSTDKAETPCILTPQYFQPLHQMSYAGKSSSLSSLSFLKRPSNRSTNSPAGKGSNPDSSYENPAAPSSTYTQLSRPVPSPPLFSLALSQPYLKSSPHLEQHSHENQSLPRVKQTSRPSEKAIGKRKAFETDVNCDTHRPRATTEQAQSSVYGGSSPENRDRLDSSWDDPNWVLEKLRALQKRNPRQLRAIIQSLEMQEPFVQVLCVT